MIIEYSVSKELKDLEQDFNKAYPYLKLDFKPGNSAVIKGTTTLGDLNKNITPGYIEIKDDMTVGQLESLFADVLRLNVKILRKSGNIWMQTSITNSWTLSQQNEHAREISSSRIF